MSLEIRAALESDEAAIRRVIRESFGKDEGDEVADLVAALSTDPTARPLVSLVAVLRDEVVGHVLFSRAGIDGMQRRVEATILAPLCVVPRHQGCGVGAALAREGLAVSRRSGCGLAFVLGHPGYYPKHGFVPAGRHGLAAPYPIPPQHADAWMVCELRRDLIGAAHGTVTCADALMDPKYWRD